MTTTKEVTCRYGITYEATFSGTRGVLYRSFDHLTRCCCFCCYNKECTEPRDERIPDCGYICGIYGMKDPPCEKNKHI
jgi:hypothetical protein